MRNCGRGADDQADHGQLRTRTCVSPFGVDTRRLRVATFRLDVLDKMTDARPEALVYMRMTEVLEAHRDYLG